MTIDNFERYVNGTPAKSNSRRSSFLSRMLER